MNFLKLALAICIVEARQMNLCSLIGCKKTTVSIQDSQRFHCTECDDPNQIPLPTGLFAASDISLMSGRGVNNNHSLELNFSPVDWLILRDFTGRVEGKILRGVGSYCRNTYNKNRVGFVYIFDVVNTSNYWTGDEQIHQANNDAANMNDNEQSEKSSEDEDSDFDSDWESNSEDSGYPTTTSVLSEPMHVDTSDNSVPERLAQNVPVRNNAFDGVLHSRQVANIEEGHSLEVNNSESVKESVADRIAVLENPNAINADHNPTAEQTEINNGAVIVGLKLFSEPLIYKRFFSQNGQFKVGIIKYIDIPQDDTEFNLDLTNIEVSLEKRFSHKFGQLFNARAALVCL